MAIEETIAETPPATENTTRLLIDGPWIFSAMFTAMHCAKTSINLEYYIFEDIVSDGEHLVDLLIAKRHQGVAVNIIYDSYGVARGTAKGNRIFSKRFPPKRSGGELALNDDGASPADFFTSFWPSKGPYLKRRKSGPWSVIPEVS